MRTIDIHADVIIPETTALMSVKTAPDNASVISPDLVRERFATMDEWGTDMQALSINANWYGLDRDVAQKMTQLQNEKLAQIGRKVSRPLRRLRFGGLAVSRNRRRATGGSRQEDSLRGAAIGGHANGDELSNPKFDPFWKKAEELGCVVFMHPQGIPEMNKRLAGAGGLTNVIGNPLETTIFLSHLIFV